jgi:PKHD-type hydroxylase
MKTKLSLDPVFTSRHTFAWSWWDNMIDPVTLEKIIEYCDSLILENSAVINKNDEGKLILSTESKIRKSKIAMPSVTPENRWLFDQLMAIAEFVNDAHYHYDLTGFDHFQYTVYDNPHDEYDWHTDMVYGGDFPEGMVLPRKLSFSIILSDSSEFEGGEFQILTSVTPETCEQKKGRVLAFPANVLHRVTPVTKGIRKSIVFWVVGPKFK